MRLGELLEASDLAGAGVTLVSVEGDDTVEVTDITLDSRQVRPGSLFACVPGQRLDGHLFAPQAVASGAGVLLVNRPVPASELPRPVTQVVVDAVRPALAHLADAFWEHPSGALRVVGITGTTGKTTTATLLASVMDANGWPSAIMGTLTGERTTPEAPDLQRQLAELRATRTAAVAMEVSSHALAQHRVDGVRFAAAVFTNLSQEHLDYHGSMEEYFTAKARLFEPGRASALIVNADDPWGRRLLGVLAGDRRPLLTYSEEQAEGLRLGPTGSRWRWQGQEMHLRLGGRFNVLNALAASSAAAALGVPPRTIAAGLEAVERVPGRFERLEKGQPFTVLIDYAHKPDALRNALTTARELTDGRVILVFGAGGDRDRGKRPMMGEVATSLADLTVLTTDNPRSEDPLAIIEEVRAGAVAGSELRVEPDRARAIALALGSAGAGDLVLIAGKGHETYQEIGGRRVRFDDAEVAAAYLERERASGDHPGPAGESGA